MPPDAVRRIRRLDEYSMREAPDDRVGFARLGEFKGLENEAFVVVDLPPRMKRLGHRPSITWR